MKIEKNLIATIHYTLTNDGGEVIDSSVGEEPLSYLSGASNVIPGLDDALMGLEKGDTKKITIQPAQGYGEHDAQLVQKLPTDMFTGIEEVQVGMEFETQDPEGGNHFVVVTQVEEDGITVDGNHELAGMVLHFDVSVEDVREATEAEIGQGRVH